MAEVLSEPEISSHANTGDGGESLDVLSATGSRHLR